MAGYAWSIRFWHEARCCYSTRQPFLFGCKGFVKQHLEVGLVANAALGGERARPGNVLRVEPNGRGRGDACSVLAGESGGRAGPQFAAGRSLLEGFGDFFAVVVPPLRCLLCKMADFILHSQIREPCLRTAGCLTIPGILTDRNRILTCAAQ